MCNLCEITNNCAVMDTSEYRHCGAELPVRVTKQGCQPRADIATMQSHCLNVTAEVSCAKGKNHYKRKQKNQYDYGLFLQTLGYVSSGSFEYFLSQSVIFSFVSNR